MNPNPLTPHEKAKYLMGVLSGLDAYQGVYLTPHDLQYFRNYLLKYVKTQKEKENEKQRPK